VNDVLFILHQLFTFFLFWPGANSALTGHFIKAECRSVRAKHCSLCIG